MRRYLGNLLIAVDQGGNAFTGGNPDETISSRVGRSALRGEWRGLVCEHIINLMFLVLLGQRDHCRASIEWDET